MDIASTQQVINLVADFEIKAKKLELVHVGLDTRPLFEVRIYS